MAKSLRSKWRRRMRAVKRERYGEKENDRLIKMLQEAGDYQVVPKIKEEPMDPVVSNEPEALDSSMGEVEIASPSKSSSTTPKKVRRGKGAGRISRKDAAKSDQDENEWEDIEEDEMDTVDDVAKVERIFSKKTKRDQFGNYPQWMSVRKINKQKKKNKRLHSKRVRMMKCKKVK